MLLGKLGDDYFLEYDFRTACAAMVAIQSIRFRKHGDPGHDCDALVLPGPGWAKIACPSPTPVQWFGIQCTRAVAIRPAVPRPMTTNPTVDPLPYSVTKQADNPKILIYILFVAHYLPVHFVVGHESLTGSIRFRWAKPRAWFAHPRTGRPPSREVCGAVSLSVCQPLTDRLRETHLHKACVERLC